MEKGILLKAFLVLMWNFAKALELPKITGTRRPISSGTRAILRTGFQHQEERPDCNRN